MAVSAELVSAGNGRKAALLAGEGVDWKTAANVAMNRGDFLPENASALAAVLTANVTREALDSAFAAAAAGPYGAVDCLAQAAVRAEPERRSGLDAALAASTEQTETHACGKKRAAG